MMDREFRKAVFGLAWFHTLVIERKKFRSLGWNVKYAFNESDYSVCEDPSTYCAAGYPGSNPACRSFFDLYDFLTCSF